MYKHLVAKTYGRDRKVLHNRPIGGDAWVMGIEFPELAERCRAGHFVMLTVGSGIHPVLPRPFSVFRLLGKDAGPVSTLPPVEAMVEGNGSGVMSSASTFSTR